MGLEITFKEEDELDEVDLVMGDCGGSETPEDLKDRDDRDYDDNEGDTKAESSSSYETVEGGATIHGHGHEPRQGIQQWVQNQTNLARQRPYTTRTSSTSNDDDVEDTRSIPSLPRLACSPSPYSRKLEISHHDCEKECTPTESSPECNPMRGRPFWWSEKQHMNWWSEQQMRSEYEEAFRTPCSDKELDSRLKAYDEHWFGEKQEEPMMYQWQIAYHNANPDERTWDTHEEMVEGMEGRYTDFKSLKQDELRATIKEWWREQRRGNQVISQKVISVFRHYLGYSKGKYEETDWDDSKLPIPWFSYYDSDDKEMCKHLGAFYFMMRAYYDNDAPEWLYQFVQKVVNDYDNEEEVDSMESEVVEDPGAWKRWVGL